VRLVGHDWGAAVGYTTCLQWPRRVERFVALGALTPWSLAAPWSAPDALWRLALRAWHVFALALLGRFALRFLTPPERALRVWRHVGRFSAQEVETYLRPLRTRAAAYATLRWYENAVFRELPYFRKHLGAIHMSTPTLHLNGARDPLTQGVSEGFCHANAPHLRLTLIPDCGHFIAEERPRELLALLNEFFARA
jgi:pimeloyl-ACP methyl ester carboxylesterase